MNLLNATSMQAAWTMGIDPSGREHVVVVVKGTYLIPDDGGPLVLGPTEQQVRLVMADTFRGEPGLSAPVHEAEFAWAKPRCDVLLNGRAVANTEDPRDPVVPRWGRYDPVSCGPVARKCHRHFLNSGKGWGTVANSGSG